ncbi:hypothetical protein GCM10022254_60990 [Actinomadura meridiana]|uniref:Uncharacterized protein n=1 Tax=Actinomadura meridiana TaxID=559626 RepID=A0ABP8CIH6_9ACTN
MLAFSGAQGQGEFELFERHVPAHPLVVGAPDGAHPALAQHAYEPVPAVHDTSHVLHHTGTKSHRPHGQVTAPADCDQIGGDPAWHSAITEAKVRMRMVAVAVRHTGPGGR